MDPNLLTYLWLALGLVTGAAFFVYAKSVDRKSRGPAGRKVLAIGLVVVTLIYALFAVFGGRVDWFVYEMAGGGLFSLFAYLGMRRSVGWLAAGWALHPIWDVALHARGTAGAAHAPGWYVVACLAFDLLVAVLIVRNRSNL